MKKNFIFLILSFSVFSNTLKDGFYKVEEKSFVRTYKNFTEITVSKGKIVKITFDKFDEKGNLVSLNPEYNKKMKSSSGISAVEANNILIKAFLENNKTEEIDSVAGATGNFMVFKKQMNFLLDKSKSGKTGQFVD